MILLASFPRSGNTFFRNVLYEVYGVASADYLPLARKGDSDPDDFPVIKTHLLPEKLPEKLLARRCVYLLRDGRDAVVSLAHSHSNITAAGSNYQLNLAAAALALTDRDVGSWSRNVAAWTARADVIIRYEDLIVDPLAEVEKLRAIMALPEPARERLPTFDTLKTGTPRYGSGGRHKSAAEKQQRAEQFFRRGVTGSYRDEMPYLQRGLFWLGNRREMKRWGYY